MKGYYPFLPTKLFTVSMAEYTFNIDGYDAIDIEVREVPAFYCPNCGIFYFDKLLIENMKREIEPICLYPEYLSYYMECRIAGFKYENGNIKFAYNIPF